MAQTENWDGMSAAEQEKLTADMDRVNAEFEAIEAQRVKLGIKNAATEGGKFSIRNTQEMSLEEQLKAYYCGTLKSSDSFYFGITPDIYKRIGFPISPLAMTIKDFRKSTSEKHTIPRGELKKLVSNLNNPVLSFGDNQSAGILIDDINGDGKPVIVVFNKNGTMDRQQVNLILSIYGLDNPSMWVKNQLKEHKIYTPFDKKKADIFLQTYGYKATVGGQISSLERKVSHSDENFKLINGKFLKYVPDQFLSKGQTVAKQIAMEQAVKANSEKENTVDQNSDHKGFPQKGGGTKTFLLDLDGSYYELTISAAYGEAGAGVYRRYKRKRAPPVITALPDLRPALKGGETLF